MNRLMLSVMLLSGCVPAGADEISLIDKPHIKEAIPSKVQPEEVKPSSAHKSPVNQDNPKNIEAGDQNFQQMKDFMREENERFKAIKILNLDLERADLELKQKEIQVKMAQLNKESGALINSNGSMSVKPAKPLLKISGIFLTDEGKEALINVNGANQNAREGEQIASGIAVKKITSTAVTVQYADGQIQEFKFGDS